MELWIEYLQRHGLPIIRPQEPFLETFSVYVPPRPPVEHRVWAFFLMNNSYLIADQSYDLEDRINQWCDELLVITQTTMPTLTEQRDIVFGQCPSLERLWNSWQRQSHLFTSSLTARNVPTARRLSFVPERRHP
jgi:hypothetical protein